MFTKLVKFGDRYIIRWGLLGFYSALDNEPNDYYWWATEEYWYRRASFPTIEAAEQKWEEYKKNKLSKRKVIKTLK